MKNMDITLWKLEVLAQKTDKLSTAFVTEAARLGDSGWGLAIVADELRIIGEAMYSNLERWKFDRAGESAEELGKTIKELAGRTELLTVNAILISSKQSQAKGALICAEEIRWIAIQMKSLTGEGNGEELLAVQPPVLKEQNIVSNSSYYFLSYRLGERTFLENTQFIQEVLYYPGAKNMIEGNTLHLRGKAIRFLDCYQSLGLQAPENIEQQRLMIVFIPHSEPKQYLAVLIDGIGVNAVFKSKLGKAGRCENLPVTHEYVRECWDTEEGKTLIFLDWEKLEQCT